MAMDAVPKALCDEKHKRVDERIRDIDRNDARIDELEAGSEVQSEINKILTEQLHELIQWKKGLEQKPAKRIKMIVDTAIQWATLLILALLASKIGLQ